MDMKILSSVRNEMRAIGACEPEALFFIEKNIHLEYNEW